MSLIIGWLLALSLAAAMGYLIGTGIAYNRQDLVWALVAVVLLGTVLGVALCVQVMWAKMRPSVLLSTALLTLGSLVSLFSNVQAVIVWVVSLNIPIAAVLIGWASGTQSRYVYEDQSKEFQVRKSMELSQNKLRETQELAQRNLREAEDFALDWAAEVVAFMPRSNLSVYERAVADAVVTLSNGSNKNQATLPKVARVSGCSLPVVRVILRQFEAENWIEMTYEKERTSWEDQIITVVGLGLRRDVMKKRNQASRGAKGDTNYFAGPVTANVIGHNEGNPTLNVYANEQGNQKSGLDAKDIIWLRKEFENVAPEVSEDTRRATLRELDDLDDPNRSIGALENLGKIFESLGKVGEPLLKILEKFNI